MKVLQINGSDSGSGGAIAGYRLHQGLRLHKIDSRMLVGQSHRQNESIANISAPKRWEKLISTVTWRFGLNYIDRLSSFNLNQHPFYLEADVLNFHNLHGGYFNYLAIPQLTKAKPAVWTLHDMWSFTGHCIYSQDCDRWKSGCGNCPYPHSYPGIQRDNTSWEWKLKNWIYDRSNLVIVTLSKWLTGQARQSILNRFPIHHIPNGIDTETYQPRDRNLCRSLLDIPRHKKVLMFAAQSLADPRKGGDLLQKALTALPKALKSHLVLLTMGNSSKDLANEVGINNIDLGYVTNDRFKSVAYSAADLFIFPTRADNLPLVLQESMACGTPMVSFAVGGVPDLVRPDVTGYLAPPEDTKDMIGGIVRLLEDSNLREKMSQNCREIALQEYSLAIQTQKYINLYHQVLPGGLS